MDYYRFRFSLPTSVDSELLLALLSGLPFEAFEEKEGFLDAWLPASFLEPDLEDRLEKFRNQFHFKVKKTLIPAQNWNALWEANFQPILVDDFCGIRADFHAPLQNVEVEIVINPKMAFGTGHHETTFLVIQTMRHLSLKGSRLLDFGCGTGILSILAAKLGATKLDALDIEKAATENTAENCQLNQIDGVSIFHGTLEKIKTSDYDIILANINRNVILDALSSLYRMLKEGGILVVSGFILEDEALLKTKATEANFSIRNMTKKNNWLCLELKK